VFKAAIVQSLSIDVHVPGTVIVLLPRTCFRSDRDGIGTVLWSRRGRLVVARVGVRWFPALNHPLFRFGLERELFGCWVIRAPPMGVFLRLVG